MAGQLDTIASELRDLREVDPRIVYSGRRTDRGRRRIELQVTPALAAKLLPVIREDAKSRPKGR